MMGSPGAMQESLLPARVFRLLLPVALRLCRPCTWNQARSPPQRLLGLARTLDGYDAAGCWERAT
jgi:hypothetical protein